MAQITWRNVNSETQDITNNYRYLADTLGNIGKNMSGALGAYEQNQKDNVDAVLNSRLSTVTDKTQLDAMRKSGALTAGLPSNQLSPEAYKAIEARNRYLVDDIASADALKNSEISRRATEQNILASKDGMTTAAVNRDSMRADIAFKNAQIKALPDESAYKQAQIEHLRNSDKLDRDKYFQDIIESNRDYRLDASKDRRENAESKANLDEKAYNLFITKRNATEAASLAKYGSELGKAFNLDEGRQLVERAKNDSSFTPLGVLKLEELVNSRFGVVPPTEVAPIKTVDQIVDGITSGTVGTEPTSYLDVNPKFGDAPIKQVGADGTVSTPLLRDAYGKGTSEFDNGGSVSLPAQAAMSGVFDAIGSNIKYFSGGNDKYHQGITEYKSKHTNGDAFDFVLKEGTDKVDALVKVTQHLSSLGLEEGDYKFQYESAGDGKATDDHGHFELTKSGKEKLDNRVKSEVANLYTKANGDASSTGEKVGRTFLDNTRLLEDIKKSAEQEKKLAATSIPDSARFAQAVPDGNVFSIAGEMAKIFSPAMTIGNVGDADYKATVGRLAGFMADVKANLATHGVKASNHDIAAALVHTARADQDFTRRLSIMGNNWADLKINVKDATETARLLAMGAYNGSAKRHENYVKRVDELTNLHTSVSQQAQEIARLQYDAKRGVPNADIAYKARSEALKRDTEKLNTLLETAAKNPPPTLKSNLLNRNRVATATPSKDYGFRVNAVDYLENLFGKTPYDPNAGVL